MRSLPCCILEWWHRHADQKIFSKYTSTLLYIYTGFLYFDGLSIFQSYFSILLFDSSYNIILITHLRIRTILIFPKRCLNIGGCWKPLKIMHPYGFQNFADKSSLKKLKPNIIQCFYINASELIHWLFVWAFPIVTGSTLLEWLHNVINISC